MMLSLSLLYRCRFTVTVHEAFILRRWGTGKVHPTGHQYQDRSEPLMGSQWVWLVHSRQDQSQYQSKSLEDRSSMFVHEDRDNSPDRFDCDWDPKRCPRQQPLRPIIVCLPLSSLGSA